MYKQHKSGNFRGGFRGGNRRFQARPRRNRTFFDPNVFVNKAIDATQEDYTPKNSFDSFNIEPNLKHNIRNRGYKTPTPIQDQAIPVLLEGRDVVGIAKTGTGKTAAFLIPLINKILKNRGERVLIIAPTRELAFQINEELTHLTFGLNITSAVCIGGVNINPQRRKLAQKPNVVVGTPGRLLDLENQRKLALFSFKSIVLDEVDRMLDMGFIHDIKEIISRLPHQKHALFFSATMNNRIAEVMHGFLNNPVSITIASQENSNHIDQDMIKLNGRNKVDVLHDLLRTEGFDKVLVFGRTKWGVEKLTHALKDKRIKAASIHGNKSQGQRQRALEDFKNNYIQVLLATDVASRGIDVNDITHVINYDLPETKEDYIHRIGRTGRAGKKGVALTFID